MAAKANSTSLLLHIFYFNLRKLTLAVITTGDDPDSQQSILEVIMRICMRNYRKIDKTVEMYTNG